MRIYLLVFLLFGVSVSHTVAQQNARAAVSKTNFPGGGSVYYGSTAEAPRVIEYPERSMPTDQFLLNINNVFSISPELTFTETESNVDHLGIRHRLLSQYYQGIPIDGMGYRVHEKDGFVRSANGKAIRRIQIDIRTRLTEQQAFNLARHHLQTKDTTVQEGRKLIVSRNFTFTPESFVLAYQFDIDVSLLERWRISIDAITGEVVNKVTLARNCFHHEEPPYETGTGSSRYYGTLDIKTEKVGSQWRLVGRTEHGGVIETQTFRNRHQILLVFGDVPGEMIYSNDNYFTNPYAVSVHWGAERAFEYFYTQHNRNGYNNNGAAVKCLVNVDTEYDNAVWIRGMLAFGDGVATKAPVELDVVAHEFSHGVTETEAQLEYINESGALNESFSDIFGKAVEFHYFGDTATWQLSKHWRSGGLRDLRNPNLRGQPDTYLGNLWHAGYDDNGGVHTNSGVQNYWFYLLSEGGSGVNDHQMPFEVNPIGMEAAVNIAYRNLTEYLSPYSDYLDSRIGSLLATADLYGKNSTAYQEVGNAWDAVGVTDEPTVLNLEVFDITATTVKLRGEVDPKRADATYHFQYGTTAAFGLATPSFNYNGEVGATITGLLPGTKYYVRLMASNESGDGYRDIQFTTRTLAPMVELGSGAEVTSTSATVFGKVNPNSLETSYYFEYGETSALGSMTTAQVLPGETEFISISATITNLIPRRTYYYRLVATNSHSSVASTPLTFFTSVKPVITSISPKKARAGEEVTIYGENFSTAEETKVMFGATAATIMSVEPDRVVIRVPKGASFARVTVQDKSSGLMARSSEEFIPLFDGEFKRKDLHVRYRVTDRAMWNALVEDMDADGRPDIVTTHYEGISVLQNTTNDRGDITEESFVRNTVYAQVSDNLILVDMDGNGLKDLVIYADGYIKIYPNYSARGYIFFGPAVALREGFHRIAAGDFDNDGRMDLALGKSIAYLECEISILRNINLKGGVQAENFIEAFKGPFPFEISALAVVDLNNDGKDDLLASPYSYGERITYLQNNGSPGNVSFDEYLFTNGIEERYSMVIAHDLNGDSKKDMIFHSRAVKSHFAIGENISESPTPQFSETVARFLGETSVASLDAGDINGDGRVDLVAVQADRNSFVLLNQNADGDPISEASFSFVSYGEPLENNGSGQINANTSINDLNGDGRPEIITGYSYNYGPNDRILMEVLQNSPNDCPDPDEVSMTLTGRYATLSLPAEYDEDDIEVQYKPQGSYYWYEMPSTNRILLQQGYTYEFRITIKCYLGQTKLYSTLTGPCVDLTSFQIGAIGPDYIYFQAPNLSELQIQYSKIGSDLWQSMFQFSDRITGLIPGTTYNIRYRGSCYESEYSYTQVTTMCPVLESIELVPLDLTNAQLNYIGTYEAQVLAQYSQDGSNWSPVESGRVINGLRPGKVFVRAKLECPNAISEFFEATLTMPCPTVNWTSVNRMYSPYEVTISWSDHNDIGNYQVLWGPYKGSKQSINTIESSIVLDGLASGTHYVIQVAPYCEGDAQFITLDFETMCYYPQDVRVISATATTLEVKWSAAFPGPFLVEYKASKSGMRQSKVVSSMQVKLEDLIPGEFYTIAVSVICPSASYGAITTTARTDLYDETFFSPNPTTGIITINPSVELRDKPFRIIDQSGRILISGSLDTYTIDLSSLATGIYLLQVEGENPMRVVRW